MRVVIQRVLSSVLSIKGETYSKIDRGLLVLLGMEADDSQEDVQWLCAKIAHLRIFDDENGVMNKDVAEINGEIMVVSQFTLTAGTKKGNRPSYIRAARPEIAIPLYESFIETLRSQTHKAIATGKFGADMQINLVNDGPVTIIIDTKLKE